MKTKFIIPLALLIVVLGVNVQTGHAEDSYMVKTFWEKQAQAVETILNTFVKGGSKETYAEALFKLVQAESGLMAYGVPFNDSRLVSRLAKGLEKSEPEVFAYRLFKSRIREYTGRGTGRPGDTLEGSIFNVSERGSNASVKINF